MTVATIAAEGGTVAEAVLALLFGVGTVSVSSWIALLAYRGYRDSARRSALFLAVGIVLTATLPTLSIFVLSNTAVSTLVTTTSAAAIQVAGLVFVLAAVYGRSNDDGIVVSAVAAGGALAVFLSSIAMDAVGVDTLAAMTVGSAIPAALGGFVTVQAYRGYRRHESRPMGLLAVGVGLVTVGPFVASALFKRVPVVSDAVVLGSLWATQLLGLVAILRSLQR